jgi:hypothetical protein
MTTRRPLRRLRLLARRRFVEPVPGGTFVVACAGVAYTGVLGGLRFSGTDEVFYWALAAASVYGLGLGGAALLRRARLGRQEAMERALRELIWEEHTFRAGRGQLVADAPGQERWRFASRYREILGLTKPLPRPRRRAIRRQARAVTAAASHLLLDGPALGQAALRVFPAAGFGRFTLTADDSRVAGAPDAYVAVLDEADAQLANLAAALQEAGPHRQGPPVGVEETERLLRLVGMRELTEDPANRGVDPPVVEAALRLRAETEARAELDGR